MIPVNQFILGATDPLLTPGGIQENLDAQLNYIESQKQAILQAKQRYTQPNSQQQVQQQSSIWDAIDGEISPLTEEQKAMLFNNADYVANYNALQAMVQEQILNLVKGKIEASEEGKKVLENQYKLVRQLKSKVIEITSKEMELFKAFKEASAKNPNLTYEEFLKN